MIRRRMKNPTKPQLTNEDIRKIVREELELSLGESHPSRAGDEWTKEDDKYLVDRFNLFCSYNAVRLGRTVLAINYRLKKYMKEEGLW